MSAALLKVRVVGDQAIADADLLPAVRTASCRIASGYQLDMATLWWLIGPGKEERTLARVDCWPWDVEADLGFDAVVDAVAAWMNNRLAGGTP
jgi:hypothetical protein